MTRMRHYKEWLGGTVVVSRVALNVDIRCALKPFTLTCFILKSAEDKCFDDVVRL